MSNPIFRMEHPFKPVETTEDNLASAKRWLKWLARSFIGIDPVAEWIPWVEVLDDADPAERERGLAMGEEMAKRLDGVFLVGGRISDGMKMAGAAAVAHRKFVFDLTALGSDPPSNPAVMVILRDWMTLCLGSDDRFHRLPAEAFDVLHEPEQIEGGK